MGDCPLTHSGDSRLYLESSLQQQFFFFFYSFLFLALLGLHCLARAFSSCSTLGALHCSGFSFVVEHKL